jgi:hypothetical protein
MMTAAFRTLLSAMPFTHFGENEPCRIPEYGKLSTQARSKVNLELGI